MIKHAFFCQSELYYSNLIINAAVYLYIINSFSYSNVLSIPIKKKCNNVWRREGNFNSLNIDAKYNAVSNTSLSAGFQFSNINFKGADNTTVSYIMLEGLLPGKNLLWNLNFTKRLINNLEISIEYEGRKPAGTRIINTGTASIRALL